MCPLRLDQNISALAALTGHLDFGDFLAELNALNEPKAWKGAASVWTNSSNISKHREQCLSGLMEGISGNEPHAAIVANCIKNIFDANKLTLMVPKELIQLWFDVLKKSGENKQHRPLRFSGWLNAISERDPELALAATEIYLDYVGPAETYFHDYRNELVQLVTRLFAEAEEREESDQGDMLRRVVSAQDSLLSLGLSSISDWLKAAERQ